MADKNVDLKGPWKTKAAALVYLQVTGWAIEKQTFYNATNPNHADFKFKKEKDGFTKNRVDKYAKEWLIRVDTGQKVGEENNELLKTKTQKEIEKLDLELEIKRFKFAVEQKKYLPRDQIDLEFAGRAGILDSGYNYFLNSKSQELIAIVGGDQKKTPELIAALKKEWNTLLGEFARLDNVDVIFEEA